MGFSRTDFAVRTSDGRNMVLLEEITYTARDGRVITIPAGSASDGASTPPALWPTLPPFGRYWPAAFLHDYLYRCSDLPKALCDDLLLEAMQSLGVEALEARVIYEGVHYGGASSFAEDRAAQAKSA